MKHNSTVVVTAHDASCHRNPCLHAISTPQAGRFWRRLSPSGSEELQPTESIDARANLCRSAFPNAPDFK